MRLSCNVTSTLVVGTSVPQAVAYLHTSRFSTEGAIAEIRKSAEEFWSPEAILGSEVLNRGLAEAFVAEKYYDGVNINKDPGNSAVTAPLLPARLWLKLTKTCVPTAFLECEFAQEHMSVDFEPHEDLLRSINTADSMDEIPPMMFEILSAVLEGVRGENPAKRCCKHPPDVAGEIFV